MLIRSTHEFGRFVREERIALDLTQAQLATRVGKTRRWLYDVERGVSSPSLDATIALAKAMGFRLRIEVPKTAEDLDLVFEEL